MVGLQSCGNQVSECSQAGVEVMCMESKQGAAIASYRTKSYCARQAITRSIFILAADTLLKARELRLPCDMEAKLP